MQKFIEKLNEKERKIFYVAVILVLVALVDRIFIGPAIGKIEDLEQKIAAEEINIQNDLEVLSRKKTITQESQLLKDYFTHKVQDDDVINREFFRTIEILAQESEINLVKSDREEPVKNKDSIEYYANLDINGELEKVITFIHKINSSDQLIQVVDFNISPKRGTVSDVSSTMKIVKIITNPSMDNKVDEESDVQ